MIDFFYKSMAASNFCDDRKSVLIGTCHMKLDRIGKLFIIRDFKEIFKTIW